MTAVEAVLIPPTAPWTSHAGEAAVVALPSARPLSGVDERLAEPSTLALALAAVVTLVFFHAMRVRAVPAMGAVKPMNRPATKGAASKREKKRAAGRRRAA